MGCNMKDLNFFEPFIEKIDFKIGQKTMCGFLAIFLALFFTFYAVYRELIIRREWIIVDSLKVISEDPKRLKRVEKIQAKEKEVNELRVSVEKIRILDEMIESKDKINEILLETITVKMPEELFLTSLSMYNGQIEIVGISKDKWSIAEFEKGLEDLDDIKEIFISSIYLQDNNYNFTIDIKLEGVNIFEDGEYKEEELEENKD